MAKIGRRQFIITGTLAGCVIAAPTIKVSRAEAKYTAKISTSTPMGHPSTDGLFKLSELVRERTSGEIELSVFPSAQIASDSQALQQMKLGSIEASSVPISQLSQYVPEFSVCELPFVFRDSTQAQKSTDVIRQALSSKLVAAGFYPVALYNYGPRDLASTSAVKNISNIQGKKVRVVESPTMIGTWQAIGANPTPIPSAEVYEALQTAMIDGVDCPRSNYVAFKRYEVAKHFTKLGMLEALMLISFSGQWMGKLSEQHREILETAGAEVSPTIFANCQKADEEELAKAEKLGCTIYSIEDQDAWIKATAPVRDEFSNLTPSHRKLFEQVQTA